MWGVDASRPAAPSIRRRESELRAGATPPAAADAPAQSPVQPDQRLDPVASPGRTPQERTPQGATPREGTPQASPPHESTVLGGGGPSGLTPARKATLPPKLSALRPNGVAPERTQTRAPGHDPRAAEMIEIPAGTFIYGEYGDDVHLHAFEIDRYPVTNRDYEAFVEDTGHRSPRYWHAGQFPDELADHPVVGVDYYDAVAYARWVGKDLPFEDEWERAARGVDGRTYPWGDEQDPDACNSARTGLQMTTPVQLWRSNVSPDGMCDVVGNAWEMTHSPASGGGIVVRGGSWYDFALYAKTYFRFATNPDVRNGAIGFRLRAASHLTRGRGPRGGSRLPRRRGVGSSRGAASGTSGYLERRAQRSRP